MLTLSHFTAVFLFALLSSLVFAVTMRETRREQVRYGLYSFACFLAGPILAGWVLYLLNPR